jgi:precorrin-6A/cobalt-precorrin-6A reductase
MLPKCVLILGGTNLARRAAEELVKRGVDVTYSMGGVTQNPVLPVAKLRVGGFGGVEGLKRYLDAQTFDVVIDATHPFAAQMSANAFSAVGSAKLMRLAPLPWETQTQDHWIDVENVSEAARALPSAARVAATVGRKEVAAFFARADLSGLARMIELPPVAVPSGWALLQERPPFSVEQEVELFQKFNIQYLVSKNAGGERASKLDAAAHLHLPVIMISRPFKPSVPTFATVEDLLGSLA